MIYKVKFCPHKLYVSKMDIGDQFIFGNLEKNISYTFSGKTAISLALKYFKQIGKLETKVDSILVPLWMGNHIYMTIHKHCQTNPSLYWSDCLKGGYVYHQWGFPQNMDHIMEVCKNRNLFIIEDCAHAFNSYYKDKRLGTFGDVAIFSLAKFFPCNVGGAIFSEDRGLMEFVEGENICYSQTNKLYAEKAFVARTIYEDDPDDYTNNLELEMHYSIYDRFISIPQSSYEIVDNCINHGALQKRDRIYRLYCGEFNIEYEENITPWVMPIFSPCCKTLLVDELRYKGVESGIYHFDVNRDMFNPKWETCVLIPCHQDMSDNDLDMIIEAVKKYV